MISCTATGLVYGNPKPYLKSRQAFHPTLVRLHDDELLCSYDVGEGVESLDYRTYLSRSDDGGHTWVQQGPLFDDPVERPCSSSVRLTKLNDGTLIGFGIRFYRDDPEEGIVSRESSGFVPMDLFTITSADEGRSWSEPTTLSPPVQNPAFEICHSILELSDGTLLLPTATARGWDGSLPAGQRTVVFISTNSGNSWDEHGVTFERNDTVFWEQSVVMLNDGRLVAVAWAHNTASGENEPTPFTVSHDSGRTFSEPARTGLKAQTCKLLSLEDNHILCVYRRTDEPGLWATLSHLDGDSWRNLSHLRLWGPGTGSSGMTGEGNMYDELSELHFGYPSLLRTGPDTVLVAFWCLEGWTCGIRWFQLTLPSTALHPKQEM
jgi:hypothetical protein